MKSTPSRAAKAFMDMFSDFESDEAREYLPEDNKEMISRHLQFAEKLFPEKGLALCPISHGGISFYSSTCEHILGHAHQYLSTMHISDFLGLLHADDLHAVKKCFEFVEGLKPFDPEKYRFSIHYRLKDDQGNYRYIINENIAVRATDNRYLFLMLFTNLSDSEKFFQVKMDISKKSDGAYLKVTSYHPQQGEKEITPRQKEITQLIAKGFSNQEIANKLGISVFTIKNHKQTLFRKFNVRNSLELANYTAKGKQVG